MNDHVENSHLTKFDAFRVNRDVETASPKPYKLLKSFISFVTTVKSRHSLKRSKDENRLCVPTFKSITKLKKN